MKPSLITFACLLTCVNGVVVVVDTSAAPDLAYFGSLLKIILEDWYPKIVNLLKSPTFKSVDRITIKFKGDETVDVFGNPIVGSEKHYRCVQKDIGCMIHAMSSIIQEYRKCTRWVTEGVADWVRYYHFEPNRKPHKPGPRNKYTDGFGVAAYFLNWINEKWNPFIFWINKDCREGTYSDDIFPRLTGQTADELWADMMQS